MGGKMNARAVKQKGRDAENKVVEYLRSRGYHQADRRRQHGTSDCGDIGGVKGVVLEVKSEKRINLPEYLLELEAEIVHANREFGGSHIGAAVVKRKGATDAAEWYAVMPLWRLVDLLRLAGYGPEVF